MALLSDLMDPRGEARFSDQVVAPRSAPAVRSVPAAQAFAARPASPARSPIPSFSEPDIPARVHPTATMRKTVNPGLDPRRGAFATGPAYSFNPFTQGVRAAARQVGISPVDLATAIGYETGGTYNPVKKGPVTPQWGQHQGYIQFGEPQAKAAGIDFSTPERAMQTQLGIGGGIANYLLGTGVKPGMGLADIYAAINTGGVSPERQRWTDAAAGGAPGTVAQKVAGMGDHARIATALLGGVTPTAPSPTASAARLAMVGGVKPGGYWQPFEAGKGGAHLGDPTYTDYSMRERVYTTDPSAKARGWPAVGFRNGKTIYAAPDYVRDEQGRYTMASEEAINKAIAADPYRVRPEMDEVQALHYIAKHLDMPTQDISAGGAGDVAAYTDAINAELARMGIDPTNVTVPIVHGKEFYALPGSVTPTMSTRGATETPTLASVMSSPRPQARQEDLLDPYIDQMLERPAWAPIKGLIHTNVDVDTREQAKRDAARAFLETGGDKDAAIAAMSEKYTPMAEAMQIPLKRSILEAAFPGPKVLAREQSERMAQPSGVPLPAFSPPTVATRGQPEIVNPYAVGGGLDATTAYTNPYAVGGGLAAAMGAGYPLPGAPQMPRDAIVPPATAATPVTTMGRIETAVNNLPILKGMRAADAALMAAYDKYWPEFMKGERVKYPEGWGDNGDVVTGDAGTGAGDWRRKWIEMFGPDSPILDLIGQQYPDISKLNAAEFEEFNKYWLSLGDG